MTQPIIFWEPELLRQIGMTAIVIGSTVIITKPLETVGFAGRPRGVLAASMGIMSYWGFQQSPEYQTLAAGLSVALAVFIPLFVCMHAMRVMVAGK
ncbi:hypothetical protein ACOZ4B_20880 (plasmid) [Haloferax prahovense]|uniref:hypothetical protein n=1 Tax=Haloferax prahovense TaxID=381852 RepID=UPI003C786FE6